MTDFASKIPKEFVGQFVQALFWVLIDALIIVWHWWENSHFICLFWWSRKSFLPADCGSTCTRQASRRTRQEASSTWSPLSSRESSHGDVRGHHCHLFYFNEIDDRPISHRWFANDVDFSAGHRGMALQCHFDGKYFCFEVNLLILQRYQVIPTIRCWG